MGGSEFRVFILKIYFCLNSSNKHVGGRNYFEFALLSISDFSIKSKHFLKYFFRLQCGNFNKKRVMCRKRRGNKKRKKRRRMRNLRDEGEPIVLN